MNKPLNLLLLALIFIVPLIAKAEPYLAIKNNLYCSACHVNPIGGGERNTFGTYYGNQMLPASSNQLTNTEINQLNDAIRIGANVRTDFSTTKEDKGEQAQSFQTQNGQVYLFFQPKDSQVGFYLDEQVLPSGAQSREAFIITQLDTTSWLKVGKLMLPYGFRLQDDTAFIRQASGFNFTNSDNGIEWDWQHNQWFVSNAITNGSNSATNNDKGLAYLSRVEYLGHNWRLGGSAVYNNADAGTRTQGNVFAGINVAGFIFLAEADVIRDKSVQIIPGTDQQQRVGLLEMNRELSKGLNLKITTEYLDPETHISENQRTRHSVLIEYTPFSHLQIRSGIRRGEDIPQKISGNYWNYFAQAHFYF